MESISNKNAAAVNGAMKVMESRALRQDERLQALEHRLTTQQQEILELKRQLLMATMVGRGTGPTT